MSQKIMRSAWKREMRKLVGTRSVMEFCRITGANKRTLENWLQGRGAAPAAYREFILRGFAERLAAANGGEKRKSE